MWVFSEFVTVISHQLGVVLVTFLKSAMLDKTFIGKFKVSQKIGNLQENKTIKLPIKQKRIISLSCSWAHVLKAMICCGRWGLCYINHTSFCQVLDAALSVLVNNAFLHLLSHWYHFCKPWYSLSSHLIFPEEKVMVFLGLISYWYSLFRIADLLYHLTIRFGQGRRWG